MPLIVRDSKVVYEKPTEYPVFGRLMIINPIDRMHKNNATIRELSTTMSALQRVLLVKAL